MESEKSLLFSQSPLCPIAADVISDTQSIYFYLYDLDFEEERLIAHTTCWVKNLKEAPLEFDYKAIEAGKQPMLPIAFCDQLDIDEWAGEDLEIVWNASGDIAGLYYLEELVCILPYDLQKDHCGFASYVKENSMVAWKLEMGQQFISQLEEGKAFWKQELNLVWKKYHQSYFQDLSERYGKAKQCFDLHKDQFPTRLLMTFEEGTIETAFTFGCGMFPMPKAYRCYEDWKKNNRCEFVCSYDTTSFSEEDRLALYADLAGVCELPWHSVCCVAHGHTLDIAIKGYTHAILIDDEKMPKEIPLHNKQTGVHLLWITPITTAEFEAFQKLEHREELLNQLIKDKRYEIQ